MVMPARPYLTPEEYVAGEREAETRSEYVDGVAYAMAGASPMHTQIVANVVAAFVVHLRGKPCTVHPTDLRVLIEGEGAYVYPDIAVICGGAKYADSHRDTVTNPIVVVEVLLPSTEAYDRGRKFARYRDLDSLAAYVLIAQDARYIEVWTRAAADAWLPEEATEPGQCVTIRPIDCTLSIDEVYDKVELPEQTPLRSVVPERRE